ncbi:hypothetical protein RRG08_055629 [Elysia crispata]|uniref:Uncharacterized protein n=1 Tax=Elysia crispata TaxID=231223 RepID=A0AAE0Z7U6_9GAST|nr:hypothetical protein RRG08_055629 [Elysia crispata]
MSAYTQARKDIEKVRRDEAVQAVPNGCWCAPESGTLGKSSFIYHIQSQRRPHLRHSDNCNTDSIDIIKNALATTTPVSTTPNRSGVHILDIVTTATLTASITSKAL